jgi:predicted peptidase
MSLGHTVSSPSLGDFSFQNSLSIAQQAHDEFQPDVIVGSSRGGAVAMNIETTKPLILLAPAWKTFGKATKVNNKRCTIIHSRSDDIVPFNDSLELVENTTGSKYESSPYHSEDTLMEYSVLYGAGENNYIELRPRGEDHRLNDEEAKEALKKALLALK